MNATLRRTLRQQPIYLILALPICAIFWGTGNHVSVIPTVVYSLFLGNFVGVLQEFVPVPTNRSAMRRMWLRYLGLLVLLSPLAIFLSSLVVYWVTAPPRQSFLQLALSAGKFSLVATIIFGTAAQLYNVITTVLQRRNCELEHSVQVEVTRRESQELDLARAQEIQRALLPRDIAQIEGFRVAAAWEPARMVGGDYFDVIKFSDSKMAVCIADVVGKGVSAALLMANLQATVRAFASENAAPSWVCAKVNSVLCSNIASGKFVTMIYGVLDSQAKTFRFTNAGHTPPLVMKAPKPRYMQVDGGDAVLGIFPDWQFHDAVVQLAPEDRLVLLTDGIAEAADASGVEFGDSGLYERLQTLCDCKTDDVCMELLASAKRYSSSQLQDDATILVIDTLSAVNATTALEPVEQKAGAIRPS